MRLRALRAFLACRLATLLAEAHALCELGTRLGVVRGDHRVVGGQPPMLPVLLGSHVVAGAQVALQGLVLLAVEQQDPVIDFLIGTAGSPLGGCAAAGVPTVLSAAWTSLISAGSSPVGTELLLT